LSCRLQVEPLEERDCPSGGYLLVPDLDRHNVLRFDATTGAFIDEFVSRKSGGLNQPFIALYGPHDDNLYVSTGHLHGPGQSKAVLRYDGATGAFLDEFVHDGQMDMPHAIIFGPDGNIYWGDRVDGNIGHPQGGMILRFDGQTGAFMDEFVPRLSGGLLHPLALIFGPDSNGDGNLDLYVADEGPSRILHYDGTTGAFLGEFVTRGSGGLTFPQQLSFGPDGNLYVGSFGTGSVMRFQGPSGDNPGAPMPSTGNSGADFVPAGSGGLLGPGGVIFGPDANGDGHQDIYVANFTSNGVAHGKEGNVKRYDGITGAFIDTFVPNGLGGLDDPSLITFSQTDPVTLAYRGAATKATAPAATESTPAGIATIDIGDVTRSERNQSQTTFFVFTVTLSAAYDQPVTMSYRTVNGTATTSDSDYVAKTGTLTFAPGETTKTITIEVKGDSKTEANETFYLDLFGLSSNALFTKNRGIGTILNDD
jgi:hypothetical protein